MKTIEKFYVGLSTLPFLALILLLMELFFSEFGHDGVFLMHIFDLLSIVAGICGLILILLVRKRVAVFWKLIVATLMPTINNRKY